MPAGSRSAAKAASSSVVYTVPSIVLVWASEKACRAWSKRVSHQRSAAERTAKAAYLRLDRLYMLRTVPVAVAYESREIDLLVVDGEKAVLFVEGDAQLNMSEALEDGRSFVAREMRE